MAEENPYKDLTGRVRKISDMYFDYGGFSEVFKGIYEDESGRQHSVAIKVIRGTGPNDAKLKEKLWKRLKREARVWQTLKHSNVQEILGVVHNMGPYFALVSPYRANGNISRFLEEHPQSNRPHLILDVAKAVDYLHKNNVIHGDIKGANVLIGDDGRPLLSDFGRSKVVNIRGFTTSTVAGSNRYMAPEIIWQEAQSSENDDFDSFVAILTKEADVYAFSMVGVEILSGQAPYPKMKNDNRVIMGVPEGLRPRREEYQLSGVYAKIWDMLELCWVHTPADRLTMPIVVQQLSNTR